MVIFKERLLTCHQMPIRDGYSATHAIRTEAPWKDKPEIRGVPIVAMTASAIQGDKEKCQLAGMDVRRAISLFQIRPRKLTFIGLSSEACEGQSLGESRFCTSIPWHLS